MNILISMTNFYMGGAQIFLINLLNELSEKHNVYLFCLFPEQVHETLKQRLPKHIKILNFPIWADRVTTRLDHFLIRFNLKLWVNHFLKRLHFNFFLKWWNIQVISTHLFHSDKFVTSVTSGKIPIILTDHGDYNYIIDQGFTDPRSVRKIFSGITHVIYLTEKNKDTLISLSGLDPKFFSRINNGIKRPQIRKEEIEKIRNDLSIGETDFVFGMIARGIKEKGWDVLLNAFLDLNEKNRKLHLILIGDSAFLQDLKNRYLTIPNIHFVGEIAEPLPYMSLFNAGVLPSYFEGESMPMVVIEFLGCLVPVIASRTGSIPEMIKRDEKSAGMTISYEGDLIKFQSELKNAMQTYLDDPEVYHEHKQNCKYCFELFDIVNVGKSYEEIFRRNIKQ